MMKPASETDVIAALRWRYAVQKFDATRKVPQAQWRALLESLVLTPSSFGLQLWRFLVVEDPALRSALLAHSWNQRQVVDASHLVVFAQRKGADASDVDRWIQRVSEVRNTPLDKLESYKKVMHRFVAQPKEKYDVDAWCGRQLYIALGLFMTAAAMMGIDTYPMEGLVPAKYDEVLGLSGSGYSTLCVCLLGYRSAEDRYSNVPKVRFALEDVVKVP